MANSGSSDFKKQAPPEPPTYGQPASGIPVGSEGHYVGVNQPHMPLNLAQPGSLSPWSTGLFGCCEDVPNCFITCCCPCITFGQIAEIVDKGATSCVASGALYALLTFATGCPCLYSCFYRSKMRQQYMLHEGPCSDCVTHFFNEQCSLCQEYRELKSRGFDMTIGWQGNVEKQNRGVAMAPVTQGGMTR